MENTQLQVLTRNLRPSHQDFRPEHPDFRPGHLDVRSQNTIPSGSSTVKLRFHLEVLIVEPTIANFLVVVVDRGYGPWSVVVIRVVFIGRVGGVLGLNTAARGRSHGSKLWAEAMGRSHR